MNKYQRKKSNAGDNIFRATKKLLVLTEINMNKVLELNKLI